ncbi:hypothetical protein GGR26_002317 [Lewinella marina]|uniref:Copper-binding protein MbnP-like domain-containing protein n=1 Tax=Neolewinella marina TaxID=438751 RepID=A0A2G0CGF2_9BACT|nr:MbnP family protein [Neolewinella marina]NJB86549.1 hypothetical protein [Neolewinella marina]PHK98997.1 hypothetical protein CGL56_05925 [Neolewinella marina]
MRLPLITAVVFGCLLFGCYEERVGCLDPDAANYDLLADVACPDCCTYPTISVRVTPSWEDSAVVVGKTYSDGAGNDFQIVRFRYYLGDLHLISAAAELPLPLRPVEALELRDGDTLSTSINGNYLLASTSTVTTTVGTLQTGDATINGLAGNYGLPDRYRWVIPGSLPSGDALRTQPGRLNYRDGRGYVQARLEYTLTPGGDTLSVSSYGSVPFLLDFGQDLQPLRGFDLRIDLQAQLADLLGEIDLAADSATVAAGLSQPVDFLIPVGLSQ